MAASVMAALPFHMFHHTGAPSSSAADGSNLDANSGPKGGYWPTNYSHRDATPYTPQKSPLDRPMSVPASSPGHHGYMASSMATTATHSPPMENPIPAHGGGAGPMQMPNSPLNRPMSVPPPSAHSFGPQAGGMGAPGAGGRSPLDNPFPAHGGFGGMGGFGMHGSLSQSMQSMSAAMAAVSPLVVPQPLKMTRPNKTYHCRMCDQMFEAKAELLLHSQQVHKQDPKPYKCPTCHKCFANSSYLSQHNRIHTGVKPYQCQICERKFTQLCHLQQHIRTHTGEKPYKCTHPGCGKAFTQLSNLQSHSRSHMTDKPYRCNSCYKCYADEQSLREHIPKHSETKHLKTQICHICGKSYTQETYLARHMQKHNFDASSRGGLMSRPLSVNLASVQDDVKSLMSPPGGMGSPMSPMGHDPKASSAFMPLNNMYNNSMAGGSGMPGMPGMGMGMNSNSPGNSPFPFPPPRLPNSSTALNSQLPHISSVTSPRYFPFDSPLPFQKPRSQDGRSRGEGMIPHSLLSLEQIKNFSATHGAVFPKSEPSSPTGHSKGGENMF